ncbi:hypothetical protein D3C83_189200 [compost metagenome]
MLCVSSYNGFFNSGMVAVIVNASLRNPGMIRAMETRVRPTAIQLRMLIGAI